MPNQWVMEEQSRLREHATRVGALALKYGLGAVAAATCAVVFRFGTGFWLALFLAIGAVWSWFSARDAERKIQALKQQL